MRDSYTVIVTRDGALVYTAMSAEEALTRIRGTTVNEFIALKHLDGTTHHLRARDVEHVFPSTPKSRRLAFELNWNQQLERAKLQQEAQAEYQRTINEAVNKDGVTNPEASKTIPFPDKGAPA